MIRGAKDTKKKKKSYKFFPLATVFNLDVGLTALAEDLERVMLDIRLYLGIIKLASDETFRIEHTAENWVRHVRPMQTNVVRVMRIHGDLVLCGITNKTLVVGEGYIRRSCTISLVVSNYFYTVILPYTNATGENILVP